MIFTAVLNKRDYLLSPNPYRRSIILLYLSPNDCVVESKWDKEQKPATISQKADSLLQVMVRTEKYTTPCQS